MADLYTSQVHLKRLLAGQATPAFTPAPEAVLRILNPEFMLGGNGGLGGLNEDEFGRLQCPACGEWHTILGHHWTRKHSRTLGKISVLRSALSIPSRVSLVAARHRQSYTRNPPGHMRRIAKAAHAQRPNRKKPQSLHRANLHDSCPAQVREKLSCLAQKIGRSPSVSDFRDAYGAGALGSVKTVFGSWNAAKAACGLDVTPVGQGNVVPMRKVLESLRAWIEAHGDLPKSNDWRRHVGPWLPSPAVILRATGTSSWAAAMRSAAEALAFKSALYPEGASQAARRKVS